MLGINGGEFIVLLAVAVLVLGPERLPHYAQQLATLIKQLRRMAQGAQEQVRTELGPEFDDVDWRKLDPRQYDPRRIVREALSDSIDLDDPLGLKDYRDLPDAMDVKADKPVSRGGPGDVETPRNGAHAAGTHTPDGAPGAAARTPASSVPLDPDAT